MPAAVEALLRGHLMRAFLGFMSVGCAAFVIVPDRVLIEALNLLALAFSGAVIVSYSPVVWRALIAEMPTRGQVLAVGIFLTQVASLISRIVSLARRSFGLGSLAETDIVSLFIFLTILGALCHLNAPEVVDGAVPTRQWVRIGVIFGIGVFLIALSVSLSLWT